jgi:hypothetical protein
MAWNVGTDNFLTHDERAAQRKVIHDNGMNSYARFQDGEDGRKAAQAYADKIKQATKIELKVYETYPVSFRAF